MSTQEKFLCLQSKGLSLDEIDVIVLQGKVHASELNEAKSDEYVVNNRGQKLHLHCHWPKGDVKAFVLFSHGYASHGNRPTHRYVEKHLANYGIAYITLDLHSHGYSEGAIRCLVEDENDLLDDVLCALLALTSTQISSASHNLHRTAPATPFFLLGHSMGGGVSLCTANIIVHGGKAVCQTKYASYHLQLIADQLESYFRGCILLAPLVKLYQIPDWLVTIFTPIAQTLPSLPLPTFFRNDEHALRLNWISERYIAYIKSDTRPENHGLTYFGGIRLGTAHSLVRLTELVQSSISQATFPMLFFQDPDDGVCNIQGSRLFMDQAPSEDKSLIEIPDGRHDPLANHLDVVTELMGDWVCDHLTTTAKTQNSTQHK